VCSSDLAGISVNLCISQGTQIWRVLEGENPPPNIPPPLENGGLRKDFGRSLHRIHKQGGIRSPKALQDKSPGIKKKLEATKLYFIM
jgi:hypothetical protein